MNDRIWLHELNKYLSLSGNWAWSKELNWTFGAALITRPYKPGCGRFITNIKKIWQLSL